MKKITDEMIHRLVKDLNWKVFPHIASNPQCTMGDIMNLIDSNFDDKFDAIIATYLVMDNVMKKNIRKEAILKQDLTIN